MTIVMNYMRQLHDDVVFDFYHYEKSDWSYGSEIANLGGHIYKGESGKNVLTMRSELATILGSSTFRYNVVHLHDPIIARFLYPVLKLQGVDKVIVHAHTTEYADTLIKSLRNRLLCLNLRKFSDVRVACSSQAGLKYFGGNNYQIIKNAILPDRFAYSPVVREATRVKLGYTTEHLVIGNVGRFNAQKNHKFLVEMFRCVASQNARARLLLVGSGPLKDDVSRVIDAYGLSDRVLILSERDDVDQLYQAMDVFVLPSLFEGLPMAGVEAQCSGLPILTSSTVSSELDVGLCQFAELGAGPSKWAQLLLNTVAETNLDRSRGKTLVKSGGFDIEVTQRQLKGLYT